MTSDYSEQLGLTPASGAVQDDIELLKRQVSQLLQAQRSTNLTSGPIKTSISNNPYTVGPFRMDVDAFFPLEFDLWLPDNLLRLTRCQIRLRPRPVRSSVSVAADSGSLTSLSGGGAVSGAGSSHQHTVTGQTTTSGGGSTSGSGSSHSHSLSSVSSDIVDPADVVSVAVNGHTHGPGTLELATENALHTHNETGSVTGNENANHAHVFLGGVTAGSSSFLAVANGDHAHGFTGQTSASEATHTHTTPNHTHDLSGFTTQGEGSHTHTTPNHQHEVSGHTHNLTLAIQEGGEATSLHLYIDNVDRTTALGGPWDDAALIDIKVYLVDNARPAKPIAGAHAIKITSATVGAIEAFVDFDVVAKPATV